MSVSHESNDKAPLQGQHLLADLFGVDDARIKDPLFLTNLLKEMAKLAHLTPLADPQIYAADATFISGSLHFPLGHFTFHAYLEMGYLAFDIFIFGKHDPDNIFALVTKTFACQMMRKTIITRGLQG